MLKLLANVKMSYVPYQGSAPAVSALLAQHVTAVLASYPNVVELVKSGQLRALGIASAARLEQMYNVPTIAESGFKDYESEIWFGVTVPTNTPDAIVSQLARWFTDALQAPEIKSKLETLGMFAVASCGPDFRSFVIEQSEKYGRVVHATSLGAR